MSKKDEKLDLNHLLNHSDMSAVAEKLKALSANPEGARLIRQLLSALGVEEKHGQS